MRAVLDANVIVSAVISPGGAPAEVLSRWEHEKFDLVISVQILDEVYRVLHYPKILEKYNLTEEHIQIVVELLNTAVLVEPEEELFIIEKDRADNRYLECAVSGGAQYIVSGDSHLLELGQYQGIRVLSPYEFLLLLNEETGS